MNVESKKLRIILTGTTGMVGEGVLFECLTNPAIEHVLIVNRRPYPKTDPKLTQIIVPDFMVLDAVLPN